MTNPPDATNPTLPISDDDLAGIEKRLIVRRHTDRGDWIDWGIPRLIGEVRRLRAELARRPANIVRHAPDPVLIVEEET